MLDDNNVVNQRDPGRALHVALQQYEQTKFSADVQSPDHDGRDITNVVITGMGGSALAALLMKSLLRLSFSYPIEVVRTYRLPVYVGPSTLVIASSYSGNTEETLTALGDAIGFGAQVAVISSGGKLIEKAQAKNIAHVVLPGGLQPRMSLIYNFKALGRLFTHFGLLADGTTSLENCHDFLRDESAQWGPEQPVDKNLAKQLALLAVGKTPVFYAGDLMGPVAYKWKISWNENAKNVAFWNEYPEFNHNELIGWSSHPIEKPFAVFDLTSSFEYPRMEQRMEVSDRLLSGMRPKAHRIELVGEGVVEQMLWGSILADFSSIYVAILNNVDPTPVPLVEKLKTELAKL